ncbi:transcriptional regulator [Clostridium gelidum]|uniref:Transcriptional regulator n=1 Tax=Clostridium gelidum TaxID=704125 RepID=A0ABM7TBV6_9CLOT|nr:helix-turn-helix transcriptional regulator [Clostridium gelidum]BCZ46556.1 transcriptional regulator [Clostridium gelidum]
MNRLNIGETILQLRKEKNITQEQLAFMVGISAGAVSKWENGNSMPDISLLAPLARALNTSLDVLLSFHQELSEIEVGNINQELTKVFLHEGYVAGEAKCQKYLNEYPNSIHLKVIIAGLLETYLMMSKDNSEEFIKIKRQETLALFKQVAESRDPKYTSTALFFIAHIHMVLENYEESEKALKELPQTIDPMSLYPALFMKQGKTKEAMKLCSNKLLNYINNSCLMLIMMAKTSKAEQNYENSFYFLDACYKIQNIFQMGLNSAEYNYIQLNIETGEKEAAAKWFKTYVEGLISTEYDYHSNPYFDKVELEVKPEEQNIIRKKMLQSLIDEDEFKSLAGIIEYEKAIKELKVAVSEM